MLMDDVRLAEVARIIPADHLSRRSRVENFWS
jgi:hypothetical protein